MMNNLLVLLKNQKFVEFTDSTALSTYSEVLKIDRDNDLISIEGDAILNKEDCVVYRESIYDGENCFLEIRMLGVTIYKSQYNYSNNGGDPKDIQQQIYDKFYALWDDIFAQIEKGLFKELQPR